jgi:hypothetical protein
VVTITRYQKDAVTSRLPFTLWVNANDSSEASVVLGASVPMLAPVVAGGAPSTSYQFQSVGTTIRCSAKADTGNVFRVDLNVVDSSVVPAKEGASTSFPSTQSLRSSSVLFLRDGQTAEFLSTTDKVTGEVTKIDVLATVLR